MATGENLEGETLIEKAGGNGKAKKQRLHNKNQSPNEKGGDGSSGSKIKRPQYCTICKNHDLQVLKKRHKCPYRDCQCALCQLSRRVQCIMCHQQRLWRFRKSLERRGGSSTVPQGSNSREPSCATSPSSSSSSVGEGDCQMQEPVVDDPLTISELTNERETLKSEGPNKQQVCDKCRNHNLWVLKRGHKGQCPYESCCCKYCSFTIKRRDLMKHQQRVRRAHVTSLPAKVAKDYALQPAEAVDKLQERNGPPVDDSAVSSPDTSIGVEEEQFNISNPPLETQVSWPSCSSENMEEARISPAISQESSRECAFQQPITMYQTSHYTPMPPESPMHSPVNNSRMQPNPENGLMYESSSRDFVSSQDFTARNYYSEPELLLSRQNIQPKFGVELEDFQLRHMATKEAEVDTSFSSNGNNFKGSSLCIPLSHTQLTLPQHQIQPHLPHHQVMTTNPTTFELHSMSLMGLPCGTSSTLHTSEVAQPQPTALPSAACKAYVPVPFVQNQAMCWQQNRLTTLERTNSG